MVIDLDSLFSDLNSPVPKADTKVVLGNYPTVHQEDREPVTLISPNLEKGPWIAGGAALRWYQGMPVGESDIDVFCKNAIQAKNVIDNIKSYGRYSVKFESENAVTLSYWGDLQNYRQWTVQIITRRYFSSLEEVINSFDLTVCEIGTAGNEWKLGPLTARDIREKNLRFKLPLQPDSPKRLTKYWVYGFRPVDGTLDQIKSDPETRWKYELDEDYNNAF